MIAPIHYSFVMGFGLTTLLTLALITWWSYSRSKKPILSGLLFFAAYAWVVAGFLLAKQGAFLDTTFEPTLAWRMSAPLLLILMIWGYVLHPLEQPFSTLMQVTKLPTGLLMFLSQPFGSLYLMTAFGLMGVGATAPWVEAYKKKAPYLKVIWGWISLFNLFHLVLLTLQTKIHTGTEIVLYQAPLAWISTFYLPIWFLLQVGIFREFMGRRRARTKKSP